MTTFFQNILAWIYAAVIAASVSLIRAFHPLWFHARRAGEGDEAFYLRGVRKLAGVVALMVLIMLLVATFVPMGGGKNWLVLFALALALPYTFAFWATTAVPLAAFDVVWDLNPNRSREYFRGMSVVMMIETAYALAVMILPLSNYPGLIPVLLISVLLMALGYANRKKRLAGVGGTITVLTIIVFLIPPSLLKAWVGVFGRGTETVVESVDCINNPDCLTEEALAEQINAKALKKLQTSLKGVSNFEGLVKIWCEGEEGSMEREFIESVADKMTLSDNQRRTRGLMKEGFEEVCEEPKNHSPLAGLANTRTSFPASNKLVIRRPGDEGEILVTRGQWSQEVEMRTKTSHTTPNDIYFDYLLDGRVVKEYVEILGETQGWRSFRMRISNRDTSGIDSVSIPFFAV